LAQAGASARDQGAVIIRREIPSKKSVGNSVK
jgi:hypothetical protein